MKGTRAQGKAYERKFGKFLAKEVSRDGSVLSGGEFLERTWIKFKDSGGFGWAEPDHLVLQDDLVWIFECKRTHVDEVYEQMLELYSPLVAELWPGCSQVRVEVCKNLGGGHGGRAPSRIRGLDGVFEKDQDVYVWHWI